ncbi:MAG: hypothetical protein M1816_002285 [Peltula sp. TS41687]|nr:MAG: hypothetical protein M1816_002285 [Peltula sp. TS41687]
MVNENLTTLVIPHNRRFGCPACPDNSNINASTSQTRTTPEESGSQTMASSKIPRFLLPRGLPLHHLRVFRSPTPTILHPTIITRNAFSSSSSSNSKAKPPPPPPIGLEKPTKYTPPSHGSRWNRPQQPRQYPGPSTTTPPVKKRKRYPNTFPEEGTFMYWFLTNRMIHVGITLGTLCTLASIVTYKEFHRTSPFAHMLPPAGEFFRHPVAGMQTYIEVFKLNTAHTTEVTMERRKKKVEDVRKRSEYRKAHGLDKDEGFGGWVTKGGDKEALRTDPIPEKKEEEESKSRSTTSAATTSAEPEESKATASASGTPVVAVVKADGGEEGNAAAAQVVESPGPGGHRDFERKRRPVKKWLGIW